MTEDQILEDFPELTREDINACFAFAADRERKLFVAPALKLLLDENLSDRIISRVADLFPDWGCKPKPPKIPSGNYRQHFWV
jgi:hypothetical protein